MRNRSTARAGPPDPIPQVFLSRKPTRIAQVKATDSTVIFINGKDLHKVYHDRPDTPAQQGQSRFGAHCLKNQMSTELFPGVSDRLFSEPPPGVLLSP